MSITLLLGGARSGKSSLAVARALDWQRADADSRLVVFVATGSAGDGEMADRILRHQAERPRSWSTIEAPIDLVAALRSVDAGEPQPAVIIDCLSMWVANHLMGSDLTGSDLMGTDLTGPRSEQTSHVDAFSEEALVPERSGEPFVVDWEAAEAELLRQVDECFSCLVNRAAPTWFVTNEVGLSLVPMSALGRRYRDVLGRVNAKVSLHADEAFLTVAGRVLRLERP